MKALTLILGVITGGIITILISSLLGALMVHSFYFWFIIPVFHTPEITLGQALGLSFFIGLFRPTDYAKEKKEGETTLTRIFTALGAYGLIYLFGYILHLFLS